MSDEIASDLTCPVPDAGGTDCITLAHGEGGRLMRRLIHESILPTVGNEYLAGLNDAAVLPPCQGPLTVTTDSFVVSPLFFPGGDIGSLAVYGTVNDLAMAGARPLWISLALIIEEGLRRDVLQQVLASVARAAEQVGVQVVAGDTKVVPRGAADGLFLNTTGIGEQQTPAPAGPAALKVGDEILVSGPIARHGMAVLAVREGLQFDPAPTSDSASLVAAVDALRNAEIPVRALRDATRGGLGAVLHEWAEAAGHTLSINEDAIPLTPEVRGACEVLGLDPVHVACEGTMVIAIPSGTADAALETLRSVPAAQDAQRIGRVRDRGLAPVVIRRSLGQELPLDEPLGAPLPRIC